MKRAEIWRIESAADFLAIKHAIAFVFDLEAPASTASN